jgi:hypothetical protein
MQIDFGLTAISQREVSNIYNTCWSVGDVYHHLTNDIKVRTFLEVLSAIYKGVELKEALISGLCEIETANRDSISRKVRDWLNNKYAPSEREDLIKICFALKLDELKSGNFLSLTSEGTFHLRNPRELVFAYCLRTGKSYGQALEMIGRLKPIDHTKKTVDNLILTKTLANSFENVYDDESFYEFYAENYDSFGEIHNTAYIRFLFFINLLVEPEYGYLGNELKYSDERIVDEYLRMNLPLDKRTSKYSVLQKTIRKFWPNATSITKMRSREEDVTRRVLLLLYLITEGGITGEDSDAFILDEDLADEERFEEHYWRLNSMLNDCGMSRLDPRNVFDWLILYCLKSSDDEAMSERMQGVLDVIFDTETA